MRFPRGVGAASTGDGGCGLQGAGGGGSGWVRRLGGAGRRPAGGKGGSGYGIFCFLHRGDPMKAATSKGFMELIRVRVSL